MFVKGFPSKTGKVADFIRKEIRSGKLSPGERIMPIRGLAAKFSVCRKVVEVAFDMLVQEKLVERKPKQGFYVSAGGSRRLPTVAIFSETKGHLYENQTNRLVRGFQERNCLTIIVDIGEFCSNKARQGEILEDIVGRDLFGMVIDGVGDFPYDLVARLSPRLPRLAFFNRFESCLEFKAVYVLTDSLKGISDAAAYLARKYRRPMFVIHDLSIARENVRHTSGDDCVSAYRKTARKFKLPELVFFDNGRNLSDLEEIMGGAGRPDAILAMGDFRAKKIFDICKRQGLKVPGDVALMGYYNTPWAEMLEVPLSSVSIREELIADTVVDRMMEDRFRPDKIYVRPELVLRESA